MTTYRNDTLRLSYSYPATYTDASSIVGTALQAGMTHEDTGGKEMSHCLTFPLSAMDGSGKGLGLVLIGRADADCMKKKFTAEQLPEYTQSEVQELTAFGAHPEFGQPMPFTVQGHAADLLRGTFSLPTGQRLHTMVACVLLKPDVVCWQFLASSEERLNIMSAFPVSLEGAQPMPLVPATMLAKP